MEERFLESLIHGPEGVIVAQVPLAEDARAITGILEVFRECFFRGMHHGSTDKGIHHAGAVIVAARQEAGPGGRADRRHIEALETGAPRVEGIQMGRLEQGMTMDCQIAIALIVGNDDDQVGRTFVVTLCGGDACTSRDEGKN